MKCCLDIRHLICILHAYKGLEVQLWHSRGDLQALLLCIGKKTYVCLFCRPARSWRCS